MRGDGRRVVWVLGAGFSAGLGAPLLGNLFSPASAGDVAVRWKEKDHPKLFGTAADRVRWLYEFGSTNDRIRPLGRGKEVQGERLWTNAEDFIEYLDIAATPPENPKTPRPHFERLRSVQANNCDGQQVDVETLSSTARRLIAAECSGFLEGTDTRGEKWRPYARWERLLDTNDTIISFNYDQLVETLQVAQDENSQDKSYIRTVVPGEPVPDSCRLVKLHGSVNWRKVSESKFEVMGHPCALDCKDEEMAIATPGPSKMRTAEGYRCLWDMALDVLKKAQAIVFVGYRFPETDAYAREQLLGAIADNGGPGSNTSRDLPLHIVLGDAPGHSKRLESLLGFACKRHRKAGRGSDPSFTVTTHPLVTQDFLALVRPEDLLV